MTATCPGCGAEREGTDRACRSCGAEADEARRKDQGGGGGPRWLPGAVMAAAVVLGGGLGAAGYVYLGQAPQRPAVAAASQAPLRRSGGPAPTARAPGAASATARQAAAASCRTLSGAAGRAAASAPANGGAGVVAQRLSAAALGRAEADAVRAYEVAYDPTTPGGSPYDQLLVAVDQLARNRDPGALFGLAGACRPFGVTFPAVPPPPSPPAPAVAATPDAAAVRAYWSDMDRGNFQGAWALGGDHLQAAAGSVGTFAVDNASAVGTSSVTVTGGQAATGRVDVRLTTGGASFTGHYTVARGVIVAAHLRAAG